MIANRRAITFFALNINRQLPNTIVIRDVDLTKHENIAVQAVAVGAPSSLAVELAERFESNADATATETKEAIVAPIVEPAEQLKIGWTRSANEASAKPKGIYCEKG